MEAIGREARNTVVQSEMKRRSFRGVIDVIYGGEKPENVAEKAGKNGKGSVGNSNKRKADNLENLVEEDATTQSKPMSKSQQKRQAKKARLEASKAQDNATNSVSDLAPTQEGNHTSTTMAPLQNNG